MQRLEAKNPPERAVFTAETRNAQNRQLDPRRNGLFSRDDGFYGSGRVDGGREAVARKKRPQRGGELRPFWNQATGCRGRPGTIHKSPIR